MSSRSSCNSSWLGVPGMERMLHACTGSTQVLGRPTNVDAPLSSRCASAQKQQTALRCQQPWAVLHHVLVPLALLMLPPCRLQAQTFLNGSPRRARMPMAAKLLS